MPRRCDLLPLLLAAVTLVSLSVVSAQDGCHPDDHCRDSPGADLCSGHGSCVCGLCDCNQDMSGQFCECDDRVCERLNGLLCGGAERGECRCGTCTCRRGWRGSACQCPTSNASCMEPGSDRICSNKGSCECGRCRCAEYGGESYSGRYCETCPTCVGKCDIYRHCVECLAFDIGPLKDRCPEACGQLRIDLEERPTVSDSSDRMCVFTTEEGCRFSFIYGGGGALRVKRRLDCPVAAPGLTTPPSASGPSNSGSTPANSAVTWAAELLTALWWW